MTSSIIGSYDQFGGQQQSIQSGAQYASKGPSMSGMSQRAIPTNIMSAQAFVAALIGICIDVCEICRERTRRGNDDRWTV